jgi:hypothetical protein
MTDEIETRITLKRDAHNRICIWMGNVQSTIYTDHLKHLMVRGRQCLARIGHPKGLSHILNKLTTQESKLLTENFSVVIEKARIWPIP